MAERETVNEYQQAVVQAFHGGMYGQFGDISDYKELVSKLKKESGSAVLLALLADLRGIDDTTEASTLMINADIGVKSAMAAVGAVAMRSYRP